MPFRFKHYVLSYISKMKCYKIVWLWETCNKLLVKSWLFCVCVTDIYGRSQIFYTSPCNGVGSHGAQIGSLWVFADHARKNKHNINAPTIFAHRAAFYAYLSSPSDRSWCRWHTLLTNYRYFGYFDYRKHLNTQFEPMPESRWRSFWDFPCISMVCVYIAWLWKN